MAVVINTNYAATIASNNLSASNAALQKSLNRLSSGSKIVSPADDAGGLAVSLKLSAAATRSGATSTNIANTVSYLETQDGVLSTAGDVLNRISELYTLYQDPTKSASDKANYDVEFNQLQLQLTSLAAEKFNGVALFGSAGAGAVESVAVSEDGSQTVAITAKDLSATDVGIGGLITETSLGGFTDISSIATAIENVATLRAQNGSEQSRLGFASDVLTTNKANLEAANSRIVDVDVASESTQLARWNTLVQAGTSMLSQANSSSQIALSLLQ
ncbi:flagellin [Opitutaceae bacterium TAV4]|uniref:flagellin n=1 Tax=Geminisphaera colitermitum TaxID=1148786 RepID=UPI000158C646|nr:flagellin [Geminisphaera colitermitum]RRJ96251.1 flagellin [Opitutaceae bacterium TAV4]RRK00397.1 flagellin [Opitutaceae bacterium TAV3]